MSKANVDIFGRIYELDIIFDLYEGEEIIDNQKRAADMFINNVKINESLNDLQQYIIDDSENSVEKIDNIFKYIMPESIYILRNEKIRTVAIMLKYKYDLEHGIAIVFENEKLSKIGPQDIVL